MTLCFHANILNGKIPKGQKKREKLSVFDSLNRLQILSWQPDSSTRQQLLTPKDTKGKRGQRIYSDTSSQQRAVTHWMFGGKCSFSHPAGVEQDNCFSLSFFQHMMLQGASCVSSKCQKDERVSTQQTYRNDCAYLKLLTQDRCYRTNIYGQRDT